MNNDGQDLFHCFVNYFGISLEIYTIDTMTDIFIIFFNLFSIR